MVLSLADAIAIFNKWKEDSAEILVVIESPFQQSRRGILEQGIDWALGLQGQMSEASIDPTKKGKKAGRVVLQAPTGNLSLSIGLCTFVYEEPREAKAVVREEAESATVSALSVFFPSNEVFVFYELREPAGENQPSCLEHDLMKAFPPPHPSESRALPAPSPELLERPTRSRFSSRS